MGIKDNVVCQMMDVIASAPSLLYYVVTSPTQSSHYGATTDTAYKWVFQAVFVIHNGNGLDDVIITADTFGEGVIRFADAIMEYIGVE